MVTFLGLTILDSAGNLVVGRLDGAMVARLLVALVLCVDETTPDEPGEGDLDVLTGHEDLAPEDPDAIVGARRLLELCALARVVRHVDLRHRLSFSYRAIGFQVLA